MLENFLKFVIVEDFRGHRTLWPFGIVKGDGTLVLFSYHNAIDGKFSDTADLKAAKRQHVADQVARFRTENVVDGRGVCAVTGLGARGEELHVDHNFDVITFVQLWQNFLTEKGISNADVGTIRGDSQQRFFANIQLGNDWSAYHAKHAQLRLVLAEVNIRGGRNYESNGQSVEPPSSSPVPSRHQFNVVEHACAGSCAAGPLTCGNLVPRLRAGVKWSEDETTNVMLAFDKGVVIDVIAAEHQGQLAQFRANWLLLL